MLYKMEKQISRLPDHEFIFFDMTYIRSAISK